MNCSIALKQRLRLQCDGNCAEHLVAARTGADPLPDLVDTFRTDLAEECKRFNDPREALHIAWPRLIHQAIKKRIPLPRFRIVLGPEKGESHTVGATPHHSCLSSNATAWI